MTGAILTRHRAPEAGAVGTHRQRDTPHALRRGQGVRGPRPQQLDLGLHPHANFIVNNGGATAEDIRWLIATARCEVREKFGVWMKPEVKLLGPWATDALARP